MNTLNIANDSIQFIFTDIPLDIIWDHLNAMKDSWHAGAYHLLENNCSNGLN